MEENKYGIILDGKMDEAVWDTVEGHSGFVGLVTTDGGKPAPVDTIFKVLPCEDRIYVGVKCFEPDMQFVLDTRYKRNSYSGHAIEMFFSPSGNSFEFYQFVVTINGQTMTQYYSEGGNIRPDFYRPDWSQAVHIDNDYWSIEVEIPLTAFYWTYQEKWSSKWLMNIARNRIIESGATQYSTWSPLQFRFLEPANFNSLDGFPMRKVEDDVRIVIATVDMQEETADGYKGVMTVKTDNAVAGEFTFESNFAEPVQVKLEAGSNEFNAPCFYEKLGRNSTTLSLTRKSDGKVFKRSYPVLVEYVPIKLRFELPEYRCNFYPGQDYSKIVGTVKSVKPVTLKLEGPGIETAVITPDADGNFHFDTPNFEIGEAWLTATIDGYETKKKIRRLADTGKAMVWISKGNLVVNGKPTLRRNMYGCYYRIGEAFKRRYDADDLHETLLFRDPMVHLGPDWLIKGSEGAGGEATKDQMPSEEMFARIDRVMELNKDRDFAYYYLSDEPECRGLSPAYLRRMYEYIADKDPYHVVLCASRSAGSMVDMADWFETHPYICPYNYPDGRRVYLRAINSVGSFVDAISKMNRPDKCIGFLPTCMSGIKSGWDTPTFAEIVCHTWAGMIHGGKSLWPYASHDLNDSPVLLEGMRYIFSSFEALEEIILLGERTQLFRSDDAECVRYDLGDEKLFALVNFTQQPLTVTVDGLAGTWHEFRGDRTFTGNTFELKPLETIVATSVVKGADLPTYAEVDAQINDLEYKRTHRGSLLHDCATEIKITSSGTSGFTKRKLFDGVPDNLACWIRESENNFVQLDLTKVMPTFSKIVIGGWKLETMKLLVKIGEEWVEPAATEVTNEEFSKTYILADAITPEAMRLEFGGKSGELYEIEVF